MELTPPERDENLGFAVLVREDGDVVHTAVFDTLDEAERFAESWTERVPGAHYEIDDRSRDHTAWEAVEADTALHEDYPTDLSPE